MHSEDTSVSASSSPASPAGSAGEAGGDSKIGIPGGPRTPPSRVSAWWVRIMPFFLSALFFLSWLFVIFAPLPLMFLFFKAGRKWAWLAALTNSAVVLLLMGPASVAVYAIFVVVLGLSLCEFLSHRNSIEKSAAFTLVSVLVAGVLGVACYAHVHHLTSMASLRDEVSQLAKTIGQSMNSSSFKDMPQAVMSPSELEEWKEGFMTELPSALGVFALVLIWANVVALFRANPGEVRERLGVDPQYLRKWKAPEILVWPTILAGFFLIIDKGRVSDVALVVFKFLMAIYAIQGLAILSFFFDLWNVRGIFRALGFLIGVFLMMPLLLSLGFFDLWFDFRAKFRQT